MSTSKPETVLHVGLNKTATTWLQREIFPHHPQLAYLGKLPRTAGRFRSANIGALLGEVLGDEGLSASGSAEVGQIELRSLVAMGQTPMWSIERLCCGNRRTRRSRFERAARALGVYRAVIVLRQPSSLIESLYLQRLKGVQLRNRNRAAVGHFESINAWLERALSTDGDVLGILDYAHTISLLEEICGKDRVHVLLYEHLQTNQSGFLSDLFDFCGIARAPYLPRPGTPRHNARWTQRAVARMQYIATAPLGPSIFAALPTAVRAAILGVNQPGEPARVNIDSDLLRHIEDQCRAGNRWLVEERGLPLSQHQYPL